MFNDEFKVRYKTIPFAIYRAAVESDAKSVISHCHGEIELISITEGMIDFYIDSERHTAEKGDILIIPPFSVHRAQSREHIPISYNCICFDLSLLWDSVMKDGLLNHTLCVKNVVSKDQPFAKELQELIERGCRASESAHEGWELEAIGAMSTLFGILKKNGCFFEHNENTGNSDFLQKALGYISENYSTPITSSSAAASLYMSTGYFCRTFKKSFGCCFSDYVLAYRLEKAKIFLIGTNDKITEISSKTGFNSSAYFAKAFREHFGRPPRAYRKEAVKK
ncbi:MAG: AraC family transcriptional regulator [Clostridia bacterium]|nr:AraC family transcriptional regulator [Clostridia bacterium]